MSFLRWLTSVQAPSSKPVYAIIDTETTGLSPARDRIIELGVVTTDDSFREISRFSTLIKPGRKKITNSQIHGITDEMVANAPSFSEVCTAFAKRIDGLHLLAHNAKYDSKMLLAEFERAGKELEGDLYLPFIDTIQIIKQLTKGPYSLESLAKRNGIRNSRAHAAVDDAATTAAVLRALTRTRARVISKQIRAQGHPFDASSIYEWNLPEAELMPR